MATDPDIQAKYVHNGKVMLGSAMLLFILIFAIIFYYAYAHYCRRRRRHLFPDHQLPTTTSSTATGTFNERLDPSVLKTLPTFTFSSATHRPLHDCAVCLSEFADGDKGRVLPNCKHAFHCHCVDTWFGSHSTCPLCRAQPIVVSSSVIEPGSGSVEEVAEMEVGGCSSIPTPIGGPRKALGVIVELPLEERGIQTLKRFCSV